MHRSSRLKDHRSRGEDVSARGFKREGLHDRIVMADRKQTRAVVAESNRLSELQRRMMLVLGFFEDELKGDEKIAFEEATSVFADQPF